MKTTSDMIDGALRLIPAPVAVIGAAHEGTLAGLTAAWVTRVSLKPPLLMVSIGHQRHTYSIMKQSPEFSVSLLHESQVSIARLFGLYSGSERDKWAEVDHELLGEGTPTLRECSARFICRARQIVPVGDHDLFIGEVVLAEILAGQPALPMRGRDYAPRD